MNTQPIDPRALKAPYETCSHEIMLHAANRSLMNQFSIEDILKKHFAESVNWKLLEAAKSLEQFCVSNPSLVRDIDDFVWIPFTEAIKHAQSQPPSMADELAEALRCLEGEISSRFGSIEDMGSVLRRVIEKAREILYKAQKGQS